MKKSILRASAALQALALLGAGATVFVAAAPAAAQDYTSGALTGTVTNASGAPVAGATVAIRSLAQGTVQTVSTSPTGQFSISALPSGDYDVTVTAAGSQPFTATAVEVQPGRTTTIPVVLTAGEASASGGGIVVVGRRIQAFSGTTTGRNVDVADLVKTLPVGRSLTDVTLLAPGTTKGDTSFGNLASIGGASVAENAYYINGLNITNFDNYLGSATVPFEFYKTVEVKSGGYPAEYGRATGGIVNAVSKSGTNDLTAALHINWTPDFLRSTGRDLITCSTSGTCRPYTDRKNDKSSAESMIGELGMPIFRDRLFFYGLVEFSRSEQRTIDYSSPTAPVATVDKNDSPFYAIKVDAYPISSQHLEFTLFDTRNTTHRQLYSWLPNDNGGGALGTLNSSRDFNGGGVNFVGRYTGRFTDWFTLSASYGRMRDRFDSPGLDAGANAPYVRNSSGDTVFGIANGGFYTPQRSSSTDFPYTTERKFYRADADLRVSFFGDHHFRAGFDKEDDTLDHSSVRTGGAVLCAAGFLTPEACSANGATNAGAALIFQPSDTTGPNAGVPIVQVNYFNSGGSFTSTNTAYYLEDQWATPLKGLTLNLGVRRDDFVVKNPAGANFLSLKKNYAPRLGFTYDVPSLQGQLFGSYGWYYLPVASNTAFRATSAEYYLREFYYVTGMTSSGIPILGAPVTTNSDYQDTCALHLTPSSTGVNCNQTSDGQPKNPVYYIAKDLKPTRESEWILGYRQKIRDFNVAVSFTHRQTDNLNEDASFSEAIVNYCHANGIAGCDSYYTTGSEQFAIANVGKDVTLLVGPGGPLAGQTITIPANLTGYPKAKRTYNAFDFVFNRDWDGRWSLGGSYTLSWSKGNSEGFVNSDIGQDDAGVLQDWDFPGFMDNAYGYLPNDRRHRIKVFGAFAPIPNLILGANVNIESPRHLSCFGWNPNNFFANNYASAANHYCLGQPSPRGTAQRSQWNTQVNLSARYNIVVPQTGLTVTLRGDVFNAFNSRAILYRNEVGELAPPSSGYNSAGLPTVFTPNPNYHQPRVYQSPRYVRLGLDINFGPAVLPPPPAPVIAPPPPPPPAPPATHTCADGSVILATDACPVPPPPPPPPAPAPERGR